MNFQLHFRRIMIGLTFNLLATAFWSSPLLADNDSPTFLGLGCLPGNFTPESHAWGVSADGKIVVGSSSSKNGNEEAFRWTKADGMQALGGLRDDKKDKQFGMPRAINSRAVAVSDDGAVMVGYSEPGSTRATIWTKNGEIQDLGALPNTFLKNPASSAYGASGNGSTIVGESSVDGGDEAFRWTKADGMTGIGRLPGGDQMAGGPRSMALAISSDGNTIVGFSSSKLGQEGFRWTKNSDGSVVVGYFDAGNMQAFRWSQADGMKSLENLKGAKSCTASAISRDGSTIVGGGYAGSSPEALRWTEKKGVESIRQLLIDHGVDMSGWQLYTATGVSADGTVIVGYGMNPKKNWEAWRADLSDRQTEK